MRRFERLVSYPLIAALIALAWPTIYSWFKSSPPITHEQFEIKEVIHAIHTQLIQAEKEREQAKRPPLFVVKSFDLELHATIKRESKAGGDFDTKILVLRAEDTISRERATKVTLHMETVGPAETVNQAQSTSKTASQAKGRGALPVPRTLPDPRQQQ